MQPHSTCAIALANYFYNNYRFPVKARGSIRLQFRNRLGEYKNLIYTFQDLESRGENMRRGFSVWIKKSGDPLSCVITVHTSDGEYYQGKHFYMTHGTQHVAGLQEHFSLYRTGIRNGHHRNSMRYGDFSGEFLFDDQITIHTYLKKFKKNEQSALTLSIKIESIQMEFAKDQSQKSVALESEVGEEAIDDLYEESTRESGEDEITIAEEDQRASILHWKDLLLFILLGILIVVGVLLVGLSRLLDSFS